MLNEVRFIIFYIGMSFRDVVRMLILTEPESKAFWLN